MEKRVHRIIKSMSECDLVFAFTDTIKISVDVKGVQFYGFRVCSSFSEEPSAGEATYSFSPRQFKDVEGNMVGPDRGFRLTLEMLRRKPDSALIWYEDFRDYGVLETNYWTVLSGSFTVWRSDEYSTERVYSQLDGSGQLAWKYDFMYLGRDRSVPLKKSVLHPEAPVSK